ncbi:MAG: 5-formyltetrahydrofolate cyclo-ligase [Pseudomonadales bacterium]
MSTLTENRRLRRLFREQRRALDPGIQAAHAEAVARAVVNARLLLRFDACGLYFTHPDDGELDTLPLLSRFWAAGKTVGCPVVTEAGSMDFYRVRPATRLVLNRYGIPEPSTRGRGAGNYLNPLRLSVLFVPLVAFDNNGGRLGMGAGYYDRFLGRLPASHRPLVIGLAHEVQRSAAPLPRQPWDVPLDAVATEAGWQAFGLRAKV